MNDKNIIELHGITKRFGSVVANDQIDFFLKYGEIHALLGENGAGKSTLMNILSGRYRPDSGEIFVRGKEVNFKSPKDAIDAGIGMIHQQFMLVSAHTVLDNIILGKRLPIVLNRKKLAKEISEFCERHQFSVNLKARIWQLSVGEQQRVEIVKTLYQGAEILILDEPTAVLTPQEAAELFEILRSMRTEGYSIIFISHKLGEVLSISDQITVLRKGKIIDTFTNEGIQRKDLVKLMVGREIDEFPQLEPIPAGRSTSVGKIPPDLKIGDVLDREILKIENVTAKNDRQLIALDELSLTLHAEEIVGIAGVAGNGQSELAEVITGLRKNESGSIYIDGEDIHGKTVKSIIDSGVAFIHEDRARIASIGNLSIPDNVLLKCYDMFSFFNKSEINKYSEDLMQEYDVIYSNLSEPVKYLSGGNLQKVILARELRENPKLLVAVYPTRGLDVGAAEFVRRRLLECRNSGTAVLLISEDLDELISISDRIAVIYEGRLTFMETRNINEIGLAMTGV
ncbi:ABC transporter ATP-binding protein [bacterium]|nr:ABC transporter ATP-binding protein [bacterium]